MEELDRKLIHVKCDNYLKNYNVVKIWNSKNCTFMSEFVSSIPSAFVFPPLTLIHSTYQHLCFLYFHITWGETLLLLFVFSPCQFFGDASNKSKDGTSLWAFVFLKQSCWIHIIRCVSIYLYKHSVDSSSHFTEGHIVAFFYTYLDFSFSEKMFPQQQCGVLLFLRQSPWTLTAAWITKVTMCVMKQPKSHQTARLWFTPSNLPDRSAGLWASPNELFIYYSQLRVLSAAAAEGLWEAADVILQC